VWCDGGRYPRKLYVNMVNGQPNWRCACFEELGWSDIRQVRCVRLLLPDLSAGWVWGAAGHLHSWGPLGNNDQCS
jgi:hypothetical protein